jgi:hypothetical protein
MKASPRRAIANHCKSCVYDPQCSGNWKQQVEACTITQCDLYEHRPLSLKTTRLQRENLLASLSEPEREIVLERAKKRTLNLVNFHNGV